MTTVKKKAINLLRAELAGKEGRMGLTRSVALFCITPLQTSLQGHFPRRMMGSHELQMTACYVDS